jgi:phage/plasmid-associated DNA primase
MNRKNIFDQDMNLLAFTNGVYDFKKMEFRQGRPSDMIKTSCRYDYSDNYVNKKNLIDTLSNIFPNNDILDCFLLYVALAICGRNRSNLLLILQLTNVRYRIVLKNLILNTFGEYYCGINELALIVTDTNRVLSDMSHLKCTRFVIVDPINDITDCEIAQLFDLKYIDSRNKTLLKRSKLNFL